MAEKETTATRYDREVRRVVFKHTNTYADVTLGALRQVVIAAEGMADDAGVTVERLSEHWQRKGEYSIGAIRVTEETRLKEGDRG